MTPLITKARIGEIVNLSTNISNLDVNSFIADAQEFDTVNVFPIAMLNAMLIAQETDIQEWNVSAPYVTGEIVLVLANGSQTTDVYYTALSNNVGQEPPSAEWEVNELMTFYRNYLQPYLAFSFYYRFIAYHGSKITQAGVVQVVDSTYDAISDAGRSRMLGDIKSKLNVWTAKISKKLNDVSYTFDNVSYTPEDGKSTRIKQGARIYALGSRDRNKRYPFGTNIE